MSSSPVGGGGIISLSSVGGLCCSPFSAPGGSFPCGTVFSGVSVARRSSVPCRKSSAVSDACPLGRGEGEGPPIELSGYRPERWMAIGAPRLAAQDYLVENSGCREAKTIQEPLRLQKCRVRCALVLIVAKEGSLAEKAARFRMLARLAEEQAKARRLN
jgi:hypothetical protein